LDEKQRYQPINASSGTRGEVSVVRGPGIVLPETEGGIVGSLSKLWARGRAIPWAVVWEVGRSLWFNSRDRVNANLSSREREDLGAIVRKGRGRPWNLDDKERHRLIALVKKAATGDSDSSWNEVGLSVTTLLPPRLVTEGWKRLRH
jgi:hypothetical protein